MRDKYTYTLRDGRTWSVGGETQVMGILNVTPDSFSDGGQWFDPAKAQAHLREMEAAGAAVIDIGGESSRPGFVPMSAAEEIARLAEYLPALIAAATVPVSIDTFKAKTAAWALAQGADIINDIWGLQYDPDMAKVAAEHRCPVIVMHNQDGTTYTEDIIAAMERFFDRSLSLAAAAGIPESHIILDPGIGFGKTAAQNMEVLRRLPELIERLPFPWLLGTSRKAFIGIALDLPVTERMEGTAATCMYGQLAGCDILRVHDVAPIVRMVRMMDQITGRRAYGLH
ncbi:MAG: dihydropteroate synthase [Veillonellaceae bacterium]|nr:dihydropteroate synthase [Veillonellaceae bacterium]